MLEYHEAGERVRKAMLAEKLAAALEPVVKGKINNLPGFGVSRNKKPAEVEA